METCQKTPQTSHILIIPYPAQGHMLPLLDLAHRLSCHNKNLSISIAITPKSLQILTPLLNSCPSIQPILFPFPNYPSLPPDVENTKDLPPSLSSFLLIMHALSFLHTPIVDWANSISNPPVAIISDFFLGWTYKLAEELKIPRITFCPSGALALCITDYLWLNMPVADEGGMVNFESLPRSPVYKWRHLSTVYRSYKKGDPLSEFIKEGFLGNMRSWGYVFNTFRGLEGVYLDHVREYLGHSRVWAVGPLSLVGAESTEERGGPNSVPAGDVLTWLDGKEEGSVVYICFGSQAELSREQAAAVARGAEKSGACFVWCMRAGSVGPDAAAFEGRGLVIKGWAPQVRILNHPAVGAFVTHCGWNSVLEGIAAGTVMLTWPMGADQYYNARVLEEEVKTGIRVCEGPDSVPNPDALARIMNESVGSEREERGRARELRSKAAEAVGEGGSSWRDVDDMIAKIIKFEDDNLI